MSRERLKAARATEHRPDDLPGWHDAPRALLALPGPCGLVSAWATLRHFNRRTSAARLREVCRWTHAHGTFPIALAVAFKEHGLDVSFHSDPDPAPRRIERACFRQAAKLGIAIQPALPLRSILAHVGEGWIAIVLYDTADGEGHLSPLSGRMGRSVLLPFDPAGRLPVTTFLRRWSAPEVFRQCVLARRPGSGRV